MKSLFTLIVVVLGSMSTAFAQDAHVALFKNVTGEIKIIRNKSEIVPVEGTLVFKSDVIVSGKESNSGIVFKDGTLLTVGSFSELEVSQYVFKPAEAQYDFSVYLKKGSAIYSSGKLGKLSPESVKVNTPRATVGVRGTRFIIKADSWLDL